MECNVALLLRAGNGTDGITLQYCNLALFLGEGNSTDGMKCGPVIGSGEWN